MTRKSHSGREPLPDVFTYLDYRSFLKDIFSHFQAGQPDLSYRTFAKLVGYSTPNLLQMVVSGTRHLSASTLRQTCAFLSLKSAEIAYLEQLVNFGKARQLDRKEKVFQEILKMRNQARSGQLEKYHIAYFSKWYHPVVRELITHPKFDGSPEWMARRIFPRISKDQVAKSLQLLQRLGMIKQDANGYWHLRDTIVTTESETQFMGAYRFQKQMLACAGQALDNFGPSDRDFRMVTIGMAKKGYSRLKSRLETFWREVLTIASEEQKAESVYQVNFQLFPLTRPNKRKDKKHADS